jgi:pimeloyl-ACP methyl ester carboxylesterase
MADFDFKGCRLSYWLDGSEDAPLVAFTPGALTDHRMFDDQVAAVTARYRMLRWAVRGHGASRPTKIPFSTLQAAEDLAALLDHIGAGKVALVGQSIGGNISQDFIFRYPDRCAAAVFLGCTNSTQILNAMDRFVLAISPTLAALFPTGMLKRYAMRQSATTARAVAALIEMAQPLSRREVHEIMRGVARAVHPEPGYAIACPCLIAHGEHDRLGNIRKIASDWARRDGAVGPIVIPNAGHVANMDNPEAFNREMMRFLEEVFPAA